jgi:predicted ATPase
VVLLSGEPGIGKSRLIEALKETVAPEGRPCVELQCSPYTQNSALAPVIEYLQRTLSFHSEESAEEKLAKLNERRQALALLPEATSLLAALLSLPHPEGVPPLTYSPQKQKEKTHEALVAWLCAEAKQQPVLSVWEDLHWADPSTLELLTLLLQQAPTTRLLVVLTFRPEFTPPWGAHSYLSQLSLSRLGRMQVETMVGNVTGGQMLPAEVLQQIVSKTDGVPLFVEELTKSVVESVGVHTAIPTLPIGIPTTLHDALMARLDRLGPAKELAQLGATVGREFSYALLRAVSPLNEDALQQRLRQLVEAELVYQSGSPPQARYLFKHALVQDTAYQSLLKSRRQQLHHQIASVLEARFPEIKETQPELLAHHYTEAGLIEQAIPHWQQAGERAVQRSAYVEAISHLAKGLELLKTLSDTPARAQRELTLQIALGVPLMATKGVGGSEVEQTYARARQLCRQVGETPQLFPVLWGLCVFYVMRAEFQTAREIGEQCLRLAQSKQESALLVKAHQILGATLTCLGEFTTARKHTEQSVAMYDSQQHRALAFLYAGIDPGVACLLDLALELWPLGYPDQALRRVREAFNLAQESSHPQALSFSLNVAAQLSQFRREASSTQEQAKAAMALSTDQGFAVWLAQATIFHGWALVEQGRREEGIPQMRQGLAALQATGAEVFRPDCLALLAEMYGRVGQVDDGLMAVAEALALVDKTDGRFYEAELYRLKGELLLMQAEKVKS